VPHFTKFTRCHFVLQSSQFTYPVNLQLRKLTLRSLPLPDRVLGRLLLLLQQRRRRRPRYARSARATGSTVCFLVSELLCAPELALELVRLLGLSRRSDGGLFELSRGVRAGFFDLLGLVGDLENVVKHESKKRWD